MKRSFIIVLCLVAFGFVLAACHNRPTFGVTGFSDDGLGNDAELGSDAGVQPQPTPCDDADGDGVCDKDEAEPSAIVFKITSPAYDGKTPVATSAAIVDLEGVCSEGIDEIAVEIGPKAAESRIEVDASGCTGEQGTWSAKGISVGVGTTTMVAWAMDFSSGEKIERRLALYRKLNLDLSYEEAGKTIQLVPDDMNIDKTACGDGICNQRVEDHWSCPKDCNGRYYAVDLNNANCDDVTFTSGKYPQCKNADCLKAIRKTSGGTLDKPFCHIAATADILEPGDTVYLRDGVQRMGWNVDKPDNSFWSAELGNPYFAKGGTKDKYVTFRHFPGEKPVVDGAKLFETKWREVPKNCGTKLCSDEDLDGNSYRVYASEADYPGLVRDASADQRNSSLVRKIPLRSEDHCVADGGGTTGDGVFYDLDNPLVVLAYEDYIKYATRMDGASGSSGETPTTMFRPLDGQYLECTCPMYNGKGQCITWKAGKLYVRLYGNKSPDGHIFSLQDDGFVFSRPYFRVIGLTFRRTGWVVRPYLRTPYEAYDGVHRQVEVYDCDIRAVSMPIADFQVDETTQTVHNNRFVNIGSSPHDHAVYGASKATFFSSNVVDMNGIPYAVEARNGYFSDNILGPHGGNFDNWHGVGARSVAFNNIVPEIVFLTQNVVVHNNLLRATQLEYYPPYFSNPAPPPYRFVYSNNLKVTFEDDAMTRISPEGSENVLRGLGTATHNLTMDNNVTIGSSVIWKRPDGSGGMPIFGLVSEGMAEPCVVGVNCHSLIAYRFTDVAANPNTSSWRFYFPGFDLDSISLPHFNMSGKQLMASLSAEEIATVHDKVFNKHSLAIVNELCSRDWQDCFGSKDVPAKEMCWDKPRPANKDMAAKSDCVGPYQQGLGPYRVSGTPATDEFDQRD